MIDMSKPYIAIQSITKVDDSDDLELSFTVNGCTEINEAVVEINGMELNLIS